MFLFKKIVMPFILPPGIFIILLIGSGIWYLFKGYRKAGIINCIIGMLMCLVSLSPFSNYLFRGLESAFDMPENPQGDVIILLGGGIYDESPDFSGIGIPTEDMTTRIVTAARLQKKLGIPIIISTGKVFKHRKSEAPIVRRFLIDLGMPSDKVIMEDKSRDTIENAKYSTDICKKSGFEKPILVTSAYHMRRAVMSFEKTGLKVLPFPVGLRTWRDMKYGWDDYMPSLSAFDKTCTAMREYLGLIFYKRAY